MFEKLNTIDWKSSSTHSNGDAIPAAIRNLTSPDATLRENAFKTLSTELVNQGIVYESAFLSIPFLIEILNSPSLRGRYFVYDLIFEIANKFSHDLNKKVHVDGQPIPLKKACRDRVFENRQTVYKDLENDDLKVRFQAFDLLITFVEAFPKMHLELEKLRQPNPKYYEMTMSMYAMELLLFKDWEVFT